MEEVVCEICVKEYENNSVVPRVLSCGHTICANCIDQIVQISNCCPKCRKSLSNQSSTYFPINYSLLGMVDSLKNATTMQTFIQRRIDVLKRKYVAMETKFTESKTNLNANLALISSGLTSIQELVDDGDNNTLDIDAASQTILNLNQQLDDIQNASALNYAKLKGSTTLNYRDFPGQTEFLFEIYNRVSNREKFYAIAKVNEEVKFSRISVWSNKLVLHAFGPPNEEPQVKTVLFQEIKNCLKADNFRAILDICCNDLGMRQLILIQTTNSSLVPQFLKFCTGEMGPVYKGASFHQGTSSQTYVTPVFAVEKYLFNGVEGEGNYEYISTLGTIVSYYANDLVVIGSSNGSFKVVQLTGSVNLTDSIGKIEEPLQLSQKITHDNSRKVLDSGIAIYL